LDKLKELDNIRMQGTTVKEIAVSYVCL